MPTVKDTEKILEYASQYPNDQKSQMAMKKMGLSPLALEAWNGVKSLAEDDPNRIKVRNKVFDQIANSLPANTEVGGTGFVDRLVVKNLIDKDPKLQIDYLQKKGYQTRVVDNKVQVKMPGDPEFKVIDPSGFDKFDVFDVIGDVLEGAVIAASTGAKALGTIGAPATGGLSLAAGAGIGGLAGAGFDIAKQGLAKAVGARKEFDLGETTQSALMGAASPLLTKGIGKIFEKAGEGIKWGLNKLAPRKENAKDVIEAAARLGTKVTPAQTTESKLVENLQESLSKTPGQIGGIRLRATQKANQKVIEKAADELASLGTALDDYNLGEKVIGQIKDTVAEKIAPAIDIYQNYEKTLLRGAYKPNLENAKSGLNSLLDKFKFDDAAKGAVENLLGKIETAKNLNDIKSIRTAIGSLGKEFTAAQKTGAAQAMNEAYNILTTVRSDTLKSAAENISDETFRNKILNDLTNADAIYRNVAQSLGQVLEGTGGFIKGSVSGAAKRLAESKSGEEIIKKLSTVNDFRKLETLSHEFPDAFKTIQQRVVQRIVDKSSNAKGGLNPTNLAKNIEGLPNSVKLLIFGKDAAQKASDLNTFLRKFPQPNLNTSNTALMSEFLKGLNPYHQAGNAFRSLLLNFATKGEVPVIGLGKFLQSPLATGATQFGIRQSMPPMENNQLNFQNTIPQFGGQ